MLSFAPQKGAFILKKLISSAIANAEKNSNIDVDNLYIKRVYADEGPVMDGAKFRSQANFYSITPDNMEMNNRRCITESVSV